MLFAALRVSNQTASSRPFGATENVPNQCHFELDESSLIRRGAVNVTPPSVLRANITLLPTPPVGPTLASMYTLLFVAVPDLSTARKTWPARPSGLIEFPKRISPSRSTGVAQSKV